MFIKEITASPLTTARWAGFFYFLLIPIGVFAFIYVPSNLIVPGNWTVTAANILSNETLFRLSIVSTILCAVVNIITAVFIARLLSPVSAPMARWIVIFTLIAAPLVVFNELFKVAALLTINSPDNLLPLFMNLHKAGEHVVGILFGLWLLPMGILMIRSSYMPKVIGYLLILGCAAYLVDFFTFFLVPGFTVNFVDFTFMGEVLMVLYLLIRGLNKKRWDEMLSLRQAG